MNTQGDTVQKRPYITGPDRLNYARTLRGRYDAGESLRELSYDTGRGIATVRELVLLAGGVMRPRGGTKKHPGGGDAT